MKHRFLFIMALLLTVAMGAWAQTYKVSVKEGTDGASNWQGKAGEGEYQALPLEGVAAGTAVSVKYSGAKKVKSVKAKKKAASLINNPAVGQVIGSNGKNYDANATLPDGVTAVAMIAYVGTASDCTHGLAIALADESGTKNYGDAGTACSGKAAVTGGTWRLPSEKDWQYMFIGCGSSELYSAPTNEMSKNYSGLASKLTAAQGAALQTSVEYWSSSEYDPSSRWLVFFDGSSAKFGIGIEFTVKCLVRACLAF